jgi:hypothetical protein
VKPLGPQFVLTLDHHVSAEQFEYVRAKWQREYDGKLLILGPGARFEVVRPTLHEWLAMHTVGMTTRRWQREVPAQFVALADLYPVQAEPTDPERGHIDVVPRADNAAHVVKIDGRLYLQDGHHRYYRARRAGNPWLLARVLEVAS